MSPNFIGPDLENISELIKNKTVNEEKTEESKVDNVKEARVFITSIKIGMK